jgi:uncharacterized membrane protein YhaH (DUF805 family)
MMALSALGSSVPLQSNGAAMFGGILLLLWLAFIVIVIAGLAKVFQKAGQPWWGAIIPIYNVYLMIKIAGRPGWWIVLFLIPLVNFIIWLIVTNDISKSFGHGIGYTLGLLFLPFIFYPVLGFGNSTYRGAPN